MIPAEMMAAEVWIGLLLLMVVALPAMAIWMTKVLSVSSGGKPPESPPSKHDDRRPPV